MVKGPGKDLKSGSAGDKGSLFLYFALSLLAFFPCLFLAQAYFDNDLLAQFGPWRAFLKDQLAQGHFPLWNPYSLGGQPFLADLQNMMLYPFNYLTLPFSVPFGLGLFFFIHMFWAAFGMHLWLKSLGLSENSCRVGALLFSFCGFFWLELIHPPVLAAFAWLPWLLGRWERLASEPKAFNAFWVGFCFAMLFLCGSLQVTVGAFYGGWAYFLFRLFQERKKEVVQSITLKSFLAIGFFLIWGALPLLGQLIPTLEFSALSTRNTPDAQSEKLNTQLSLNPFTLGQFLFPRISLKPGQDMAEALQSDKDASTFSFAANWGYLGPWVFFLAFLAFRRKEKGIIGFWGGFGILSLLFCFGRYLSLHGLLSSLLPGLSIIRVPYRFLYLYVLSVCVLAAFGFEEWRKEDRFLSKAGPRNLPDLVYASSLLLASLLYPSHNWREILGLVLGACAIFLRNSSKPEVRAPAAGIFISALVLPLLLNGTADFKAGPSSNFDYGPNSKAISQAADSVKPGRVLFFNQDMYYPIQVGGQKYLINYPQNAASALGIKNFGGYNPLMLQTKAEIGTLPLKPLLQLGAIGGLLTQQSHGEIPGFKLESFPPYFFYVQQKPVTYLYAPSHLIVEPDPAKRVALLRDPGFDASQTAVLSAPLSLEKSAALDQALPAGLQYRMEKDGVDRQTYSVNLEKAHLLVFCEVMFPGWKAFIDNQELPLLTADHFLRALYVPQGQHEVEFRFEPTEWLALRAALAGWLLLTLAAFVLAARHPKDIRHA
jgi:hypothetical protein